MATTNGLTESLDLGKHPSDDSSITCCFPVFGLEYSTPLSQRGRVHAYKIGLPRQSFVEFWFFWIYILI